MASPKSISELSTTTTSTTGRVVTIGFTVGTVGLVTFIVFTVGTVGLVTLGFGRIVVGTIPGINVMFTIPGINVRHVMFITIARVGITNVPHVRYPIVHDCIPFIKFYILLRFMRLITAFLEMPKKISRYFFKVTLSPVVLEMA